MSGKPSTTEEEWRIFSSWKSWRETQGDEEEDDTPMERVPNPAHCARSSSTSTSSCKTEPAILPLTTTTAVLEATQGHQRIKKEAVQSTSTSTASGGCRDYDLLKHIKRAVTESRWSEDDEKLNALLMVKMVENMKNHFLCFDEDPSTLDELLEEVHETEVTDKRKKSLIEEALPSNPRIIRLEDGKYAYKPPIPECRDRESLLRYLRCHHKATGGGTLREDILDSLPCAETILRGLVKDNQIIIITRMDKKEIVFYIDRACEIPLPQVDDSLKDMYRSINVNGMDLRNIQHYVEINGLKPLTAVKKVGHIEIKGAVKRKGVSTKKPRDNAHVADQLQAYKEESDNTKGLAKEKKIRAKKMSKS